jgi:CheY-like chemotaxis protein
MTVYLLVVEDDNGFVEEIKQLLDTLPGGCSYQVVGSREEACARLKGSFFDLVVLDLKIPTHAGALDAQPEHGIYVFHEIRSNAPGTPIFVLTGSPAEDHFRALLKNSQQIDVWSEGRKTGTVEFFRKYEFEQFPAILTSVSNAIESLDEIEINRCGLDLNLAELRLIKIFAKKFQGVRCVVTKLGQGLSGARVVRLLVTNDQGVQTSNAVAKLAKLTHIRDEGDRFDRYVARLNPASTPRKLAALEFGGYDLAGIFYGLADGFDRSIFDVAMEDTSACGTVIRNIEKATAPWCECVPESRKAIKQIRQRLLRDELFSQIINEFDLEWVKGFEERNIQTRWACIHGDLHGCNVLVSGNCEINLIDYGDVGDGPVCLDPITLELSLLFHPDTVVPSGVWPTHDQARNWGNLDIYLENCSFPVLVRELRGWALRVAAGGRDVAASAYSYLIRQLKYGDTDKDLAMALLTGVKAFYDVDT